jgi:hypothetical protein
MATGFKSGGRRKGVPNRAASRTKEMARRSVRMALDTGTTPLDVMTARMRNEPLANGQRVTDEMFAAAVASAPYIHPKLQVQVVRNLDPKAHAPGAIEDRVMALLTKGLENAEPEPGRTIESTEWTEPG